MPCAAGPCCLQVVRDQEPLESALATYQAATTQLEDLLDQYQRALLAAAEQQSQQASAAVQLAASGQLQGAAELGVVAAAAAERGGAEAPAAGGAQPPSSGRRWLWAGSRRGRSRVRWPQERRMLVVGPAFGRSVLSSSLSWG